TGTDSEALRLFWKELENVPILQLNLKQRSFSKRG
uniref:HECT domain-containing protein n=1 Tax=Strongyloides stercoralis TaxID=6248 RepID=A0A0K0EPW2_STRER